MVRTLMILLVFASFLGIQINQEIFANGKKCAPVFRTRYETYDPIRIMANLEGLLKNTRAEGFFSIANLKEAGQKIRDVYSPSFNQFLQEFEKESGIELFPFFRFQLRRFLCIS